MDDRVMIRAWVNARKTKDGEPPPVRIVGVRRTKMGIGSRIRVEVFVTPRDNPLHPQKWEFAFAGEEPELVMQHDLIKASQIRRLNEVPGMVMDIARTVAGAK